MHDDIYDHDHPENFEIKEGEIVTEIEGLEMFSLKSVGIDIGSSTSHLIFSHITLRRQGASLSGKFQVTNREVLYRSPIMLTPYLSATRIDTEQSQSIYSQCLRRRGTNAGRCRHGRGHHHWRSAEKRKRAADCRILRQVLGKIHLRGRGSQPRGAARGLRLRRGGSIQVRAQDGSQCGHGRRHDKIFAHRRRDREPNRSD